MAIIDYNDLLTIIFNKDKNLLILFQQDPDLFFQIFNLCLTEVSHTKDFYIINLLIDYLST